MEARIQEAFPGTSVELIESDGGVYEVVADGEMVFSKKLAGRHAEWEEVRDRLAELAG
jgi:hypothetical protein